VHQVVDNLYVNNTHFLLAAELALLACLITPNPQDDALEQTAHTGPRTEPRGQTLY
jgi:hypothetical protein